MTIFNVLSLLGGLAVFLYGMSLMGDGLEKSAGSKLKTILENLTANTFRAVLLGIGVTAIVQSSSATTVMLVGFVNSGVLKLSQSIGVIMGANIGTTVTPWLLSLTGIQSDNIVLKLLKPENLSLVAAIVGIVFFMFVKNAKKRDIGVILIGFGLLMIGMDMMSGAVEPLKEQESFKNILLLFSNPILGVVAGAVLTAIIQSSSASVGVLQALSVTGAITYANAIPIIMGQNIGTCATAMISSVGANKNAKRVATLHLCFNIIGTAVFLIIYYLADFAVGGFSFSDDSLAAVGIAIIHTLFNILATAVMFPFIRQLEKLAYVIVKDREKEETREILDERLLVTPAAALSQSKNLTGKMAILVKNTLIKSLDVISEYNEETAKSITDAESVVDHYEDALGTYLIKLSRKSLTVEDSQQVSNLLHTIGDFERICDHAVNILETAEEVNDKKIVFSKDTKNEINVLTNAIKEILENTVKAFVTQNLNLAKQIEPLEQVIDKIKFELKNRHIKRLQEGEYSIETGFVFSDFLTNCERVADHCSNIAVCMIQIAEDSFDVHEYLNNIKANGENLFEKNYKKYKEKYKI
ncbi:MAG: Na/Pi cotransporter family protein [Clostridia bacterium]|nr:Na/Pi cotransporter family protein [Clostridia bacterium]